MADRCLEPGCTGTIGADGYCDTCGTKAQAQAQPRPVQRARLYQQRAGNACPEPGCAGTIGADGYCDTCGTKAAPTTSAPDQQQQQSTLVPSDSRPSRIGRTLVTGSAKAKGPRRLGSSRTALSSERFAIGAGM